MQYLVCRKQIGNGCDYTIGCGMVYDFMEADSVDDILEKVIWPEGRDEDDCCNLEGDAELIELLIIPADAVIIADLPKLKNQLFRFRQAQKMEQIKQKELAELRRLQNKYLNK
jgi:hypothetical protein